MSIPLFNPLRASAQSGVGRLVDHLVARSPVTGEESLLFIGQVAVWRQTLDARRRVPQLPGFHDTTSSGAELRQTFNSLSASRRDKRFRLLYEGMPLRYELLKPEVISDVIGAVDAELLATSPQRFAEDLLDEWSRVRDAVVTVSREVADLIVPVATRPDDRTLHCLGLASESVAIACMRQAVTPTLVSARLPSRALLYALLTGLPAEFELREPLLAPDGGLFPAKLGPTFAAPPLGMREMAPSARPTRLADPGVQSAESTYVQHLADVDVTESAVILVSNRFLFARGAEERLRQSLVNGSRIRAVISFPAGLLSTTYVPFALLVLDKPDPQRDTIFCRVDEARHMSAAAGKLRAHDRRFIGHHQVLSELATPAQPWARGVSRREIEKRGYVLSVERYLSPDSEAAVERAAGNRNTILLGDLVTVVKPQAMRSIDGGTHAVPVMEVGPSELPEFDRLASASRQRHIDPYDLKRFSQQVIQPEDVILSVKGTIGRSAVAMPASSAIPIVPSQASVILRLNRRAPIRDPVVLHMYLRSPLFQQLLRTMVTGTTIPNVTLTDLRQIPIIVPTAAEQDRLRMAFESQMGIQRRLEELKEEQEREAQLVWNEIGLAAPPEAEE